MHALGTAPKLRTLIGMPVACCRLAVFRLNVFGVIMWSGY